MAFKMKGLSPFKQDDDSNKMTPEQEAEHKAKVLEYNKNTARPLNATQKKKLTEKLKTLDPNSEQYKELSTLLNLKKNQ